jgi:hypothetical protein
MASSGAGLRSSNSDRSPGPGSLYGPDHTSGAIGLALGGPAYAPSQMTASHDRSVSDYVVGAFGGGAGVGGGGGPSVRSTQSIEVMLQGMQAGGGGGGGMGTEEGQGGGGAGGASGGPMRPAGMHASTLSTPNIPSVHKGLNGDLSSAKALLTRWERGYEHVCVRGGERGCV